MKFKYRNCEMGLKLQFSTPFPKLNRMLKSFAGDLILGY